GMLSPRVVKLGGNDLDRPGWLAACARALVRLGPVVVVHGGGRAISGLCRRLGLTVEQRDGLRVTTPEVAEVVELVLAGPVNRQVVAALRAAGLDAGGLSGVDGVLRPTLAAGDVEALIDAGAATEGMAAKLRAAAAALRAGARAVRIGDVRLLEDPGAGTRLVAPAPAPAPAPQPA